MHSSRYGEHTKSDAVSHPHDFQWKTFTQNHSNSVDPNLFQGLEQPNKIRIGNSPVWDYRDLAFPSHVGSQSEEVLKSAAQYQSWELRAALWDGTERAVLSYLIVSICSRRWEAFKSHSRAPRSSQANRKYYLEFLDAAIQSPKAEATGILCHWRPSVRKAGAVCSSSDLYHLKQETVDWNDFVSKKSLALLATNSGDQSVGHWLENYTRNGIGLGIRSLGVESWIFYSMIFSKYLKLPELQNMLTD